MDNLVPMKRLVTRLGTYRYVRRKDVAQMKTAMRTAIALVGGKVLRDSNTFAAFPVYPACESA